MDTDWVFLKVPVAVLTIIPCQYPIVPLFFCFFGVLSTDSLFIAECDLSIVYFLSLITWFSADYIK